MTTASTTDQDRTPEPVYAVLIHGWGGSPHSWDPVVWPKDWHVLEYTLPGHAERFDDGPWTIRSASEDLARYIETHVPAGHPALLIAHSMGGQLSLWMNANRPDLVAGEVVIDPAYGGDDSAEDVAQSVSTLSALRADAYGTMREFIKGAFSPYLGQEARQAIVDDIPRTNPKALADYFESEYLDDDSFGLKRDSRPMMARRTRPVLGIYRTEERGDFERENDPDSVPVEISVWGSDHGHFLHMEEPERFAGEVIAWADRIGSLDRIGVPDGIGSSVLVG
ncbi:alpha/beta fold hydrolase [Bifidobacterium simiarum]|uniref:AB hydrolase-1 domain-containing protein n=1 Tax=Bifidobacterium simiarum TaxID=2045441 RepID=A0A2M9HFC1_9BIFI|nr:alpha/beta hydrolase [Bifidobacterium simiarum]PJM75508.1 hypothetical protein CSQ87_03535 [Bifidobacterium simiarum]